MNTDYWSVSLTHFTVMVLMTLMKIIFMGRAINICTIIVFIFSVLTFHSFTWAISVAF